MHRLWVAGLIVCGAVALGLGSRAGRAKTSIDTPEVRTVRFTYSVAVVDIPEGAEKLSIWVPVPKTDRRQIVRDLKVTAPVEYSIVQDSQYGNSMVYLSATAPLPSTLNLQFEAVIERQAFNVMSEEPNRPGDDAPAAHDLEPHELVPIDGIIAAEQIMKDRIYLLC